MKENKRKLDYSELNKKIQERLQRWHKLESSGKKNSGKVKSEGLQKINNEEGD
jgi:hypothetical protein